MITMLSKPSTQGLVLTGTEIKSVRAHRVDLRDAFATVEREEIWLHNMHISPYEPGWRDNPASRRTRKLLLHRREINRLMGRTAEKGLTLVPLKIYLERGFAKIELGLARDAGSMTSGRRSWSGSPSENRIACLWNARSAARAEVPCLGCVYE